MKKFTLILITIIISYTAFAQDDMLSMMQKEMPSKAAPVFATFKSTRIVNLQSNETMKKKQLDFRIQHRFSPTNINKDNVYGLYDMFGLDGAKMRLSLDYGITDKIMVGVGRTNGGMYDLSVKAKLFEQKTKGKGTFPLSIDYFTNMGINTTTWADNSRQNFLTSRLTFVHQLIFARKFNEWISFAITPTVVHHNLVYNSSVPNDIYAIGVGASIKMTRSTRFNIEYIPRLNGRDQPVALDGSGATYFDSFAIGFDIETGGHVFQLHFANSQGLIEQQFITENTTKLDFKNFAFRLGFNISRTFSMEKSTAPKN